MSDGWRAEDHADDFLRELFHRQEQRIAHYFSGVDTRLRRARQLREQEADDDWHARRPGCIGHAMGQRRGSLSEMEGD